jgi:hypothetical protein
MAWCAETRSSFFVHLILGKPHALSLLRGRGPVRGRCVRPVGSAAPSMGHTSSSAVSIHRFDSFPKGPWGAALPLKRSQAHCCHPSVARCDAVPTELNWTVLVRRNPKGKRRCRLNPPRRFSSCREPFAVSSLPVSGGCAAQPVARRDGETLPAFEKRKKGGVEKRTVRKGNLWRKSDEAASIENRFHPLRENLARLGQPGALAFAHLRSQRQGRAQSLLSPKGT